MTASTNPNKDPKTIILAIPSLNIGGAEQFVITLAKALKKSQHHVHILLLRDEIKLPVPSNIPVHIFPYDNYRKIPRFMRKKIIARAIDAFIIKNIGAPDLLLSNLKSIDQFLAHSDLDNVYLVVHNTLSKLHSMSSRSLKQLKDIYLSKPCIGVSQGVTTDLPILLEQAIDITTIYDPVDVQKAEDLSALFVPPYQDYLINVSTFKMAKRHDLLIEAYAKSNLNIDLVLVGDGVERPASEALAKQLDVADCVHFVGLTTNPYPYIKNALAMVISSDYEGLNIAMLEAISLGTPVISTACPSGPPEVLPSKNLVPVNDTEALSQKMLAVVDNPEKFVIALEEKFYPDYAAVQYLELIGSDNTIAS